MDLLDALTVALLSCCEPTACKDYAARGVKMLNKTFAWCDCNASERRVHAVGNGFVETTTPPVFNADRPTSTAGGMRKQNLGRVQRVRAQFVLGRGDHACPVKERPARKLRGISR
jgi:hypothetical protein